MANQLGELHRDHAIRLLRDHAVTAYLSIIACVILICLMFNEDDVSNRFLWVGFLFVSQTISFFLRYFNKAIFKSVKRRKWFGHIMNFIDGIILGSCFLFIPHVSDTTAIFMSSILLLLCAGSATTSAGYQSFSWAFSLPLISIQFFTYIYYYLKTGSNVYAVAAMLCLILVFVIYKIAKNSRELLLEIIGAQLEAERANQSKTRFFAASTHDLRQPLSASAAFLTVASKLNKDQEVGKFLSKSMGAIQLMDKQISPIMELARIDSGNLRTSFQHIDLIVFLKEIMLMFEPQMNTNVQLVFESKLKTANCYTDPEMLRRCVVNLVDNSIKYTPEGVITLSLLMSRQSNYLLTIHDTGIGIDSKNIDLVLDEFYQVDNPDRDPSKGYGLGLPIVNRICDKLGIKMTIESKLNAFTQVKLSIPKAYKHVNKQVAF